MPRDGSGVYSYPAATPGVTGTNISSAHYNAYINDIAADLNAARPVSAGGTGATTAAAARTNLGVGAIPLPFATRTLAAAATIDASVVAVQVQGFAAAGDGGRATYFRSATEPAHVGKFQSADGAWWELLQHWGGIIPQQFGAKWDARDAYGSGTSGSATWTASTAVFTAADVGKSITIKGAGANGREHVTTISGFTSATVVTLQTALVATPPVAAAGHFIFGTNDASAIQAFLDYCFFWNHTCFFPAGGAFVGSKLWGTVPPAIDHRLVGETGYDYDRTFRPGTIRITGSGNLYATHTGDILHITDSGARDAGASFNAPPYEVVIDGVGLHGLFRAANGLRVTWGREYRIGKMEITGCTVGARLEGGAGGHKFNGTQFMQCIYCVYVDDTGDHRFENCSFWPSNFATASAAYAVYLFGSGGNTKVLNNTISWPTGAYYDGGSLIVGVCVDQQLGGTEFIRNIEISGNEFHGCFEDIQLLGSALTGGGKSITDVKIGCNHQIDNGGYFRGRRLWAKHADDVTMFANTVGNNIGTDTAEAAVYMENSRRVALVGEKFRNLQKQALHFKDSEWISAATLQVENWGKSGTGACITLDNTDEVYIDRTSTFHQTSGSYSQVWMEAINAPNRVYADKIRLSGATTQTTGTFGASTSLGVW